MRLPDDELDALDHFRRTHKDPPSRAQAARELMRRALTDHLWGAYGLDPAVAPAARKENAHVAA